MPPNEFIDSLFIVQPFRDLSNLDLVLRLLTIYFDKFGAYHLFSDSLYCLINHLFSGGRSAKTAFYYGFYH
ncbi:hypothetical protein BLOT_008868 [Blomia tropicalis]|nr:hypothetical protein BLOT_008868 [Blomia tropicalis]